MFLCEVGWLRLGVFGCGCKKPGGWRAMQLQRPPLWLLGAVLGAFVSRGCCGSLSHSLCYFYQHLPEPSQEPPQFSIRGYLDDQPIAHFDSLTRKMEPLVPWMEEKEKEKFLTLERVFRADQEKLCKLSNQSAGLHTWHAVWGCELREDGSKGGFFHYGYDGMDFISFDQETLRWVAAQPQAQKVKKKWDNDTRWSKRMKDLLENACTEWLQRHLSYNNKTEQRIKPPVGKVNSKVVNESLEVLTCPAFGFHPNEIQAPWTRDREASKNETLPTNVAPNSDGTTRWALVGILAAAILGPGILFLIDDHPDSSDGSPTTSEGKPFHWLIVFSVRKLYVILDPQSTHSLARSAFFDLFDVQKEEVHFMISTSTTPRRTTGRRATGLCIELLDGSSQC